MARTKLFIFLTFISSRNIYNKVLPTTSGKLFTWCKIFYQWMKYVHQNRPYKLFFSHVIVAMEFQDSVYGHKQIKRWSMDPLSSKLQIGMFPYKLGSVMGYSSKKNKTTPST